MIIFTFTCMHLSDPKQFTLHLSCTFDQFFLFRGIEPMILVLRTPWCTVWATGNFFLSSLLYCIIIYDLYHLQCTMGCCLIFFCLSWILIFEFCAFFKNMTAVHHKQSAFRFMTIFHLLSCLFIHLFIVSHRHAV